MLIQAKKTNKALKNAETYKAWKEAAIEQDKASGMEAWKTVNHSELYDNDEIQFRLEALRAKREEGDDHGLLFLLNEGVHGNMGGMGKIELYEKALFGTKQLIVDYGEEVASALLHLADKNNTNISVEEKKDFFHRASQCFGRSALMLSGGGALGNFHGGVLKALAQEDLLPNVISGSSAGAIFAAFAGVYDNEELIDFLNAKVLNQAIEEEARILNNIENQKTTVNAQELETILKSLIPNLTFQEAYKKTGRKINISIAAHGTHQQSRLLNAITSPNVLIISAILASTAVPGVYPPVTLYAKNKDREIQPYLPFRKWVDGSMTNDLPAKRLARLYGVNHFMASLTNPAVLPFVNSPFYRNKYLAPITKYNFALVKETSQVAYALSKPFFKHMPSMALRANSINSLIQQDYTGDINIIADFSVVKPYKILSPMTTEDLAALLKKGEKATWPKIETIRITTKIGRILDKILTEY